MKTEIKTVLEAVKNGKISVDDALLAIKKEPFEDIGYAKIDFHRGIRQGMPEVIYGAGKTAEQISGIAEKMMQRGQNTILITRLSPEAAAQVEAMHEMDYHAEARVGIIGPMSPADGIGKIVVATGGTSDIPVAEEAALTAEVYGNEVVRLYDVGVAGLHRLLAHMDEIMSASVIIAIAGMEGALASVIGGLADCPVDRCSHKRWLWGVIRWSICTFVYAQFLRQRGIGRKYRQRLRSWISGQYDQPHGGKIV